MKRLPVVDDDGRLAGILARSDVLRAVGETFPRDTKTASGHPGAQTVRDLMRTDAPVVLADADPTIAEAARVMTEKRFKILCVVDEDGRLLGIVDRADLLRAAGDALRKLAEPGRRNRMATECPKSSELMGQTECTAPMCAS